MKTPLLLAVVVLAACATRTRVEVTSPPGTDLSAFRTFAWLPESDAPAAGAFAQNAAADQMIRELVEQRLTAKGRAPVAQAPDLYVTYVTGVTDQSGETVWGKGYGAAHGGAVHIRRDAVIIVDLLRPGDREIVWRGQAFTTIEQFEDARPIAVEALDKLFAEFPPLP